MAVLPKVIYRFCTTRSFDDILYNTSTILEFIWKHRRLWIAEAVLWPKSKAGDVTIADLKLQ